LRLTDLLILPIAALWQQKIRTMLTTLGVIFGAFVLAASLSIGEGVQETIDRESHRSDVSRRVDVYPRWNLVASKADISEIKVEGNMNEARRERIRKTLADVKQQSTPGRVRTELNRERLARLAAIPHVVRSIPMAYSFALVVLGQESEGVQVGSYRPDDEDRRGRIVAGRYFKSPDEHGVVMTEYLAYRLGLEEDDQVEGVIGKTIRLDFRSQRSAGGLSVSINKTTANMTPEERSALDKVQARLPGMLESLLPKSEAEILEAAMTPPEVPGPDLYTEDFPVLGVIRDPTDEEEKKGSGSRGDDSDLLLPYQTATDLYFKTPGHDGGVGVNSVVLLVDEEKNVKEVAKQAIEMSVDARAPIEFIEREQFMYLLIFSGMTCVAGVALLVSALGIANTMLMSVLERTREIGIMKAVGADNVHLQLIFLIEGALIGGSGGVVGLFLAWLASFPADDWVRAMVLRDIKIDLKGSIFVFPPWIGLTVLVFTILVTTIAALYPARHASRIDPVKALRHE
jgi:putative ABC transport system permease protein